MKKQVLALIVLAMVATVGTAQTWSYNPNPKQLTAGPAYVLPPESFTQSLDTVTITQFNSVSCNGGGVHTDNSYLRRYDLDGDHGIFNALTVASVDVGIEVAAGAGGVQPIEIRLHTIPSASPLTFANLTSIGTSVTTVADTALTVVSFPVVGVVADPIASDLVVEVFTPAVGTNSLFIGSNAAGQLAPTYLAAAACGITEPTPTGSVGFPDMHLVEIVVGASVPVELMSVTIE